MIYSQSLSLESPLYIFVSNKYKKWAINLNNYRNSHYFTLNTAKRNYKKIMADQISNLSCMEEVHVRFTVYPPNKRLFDLGNVSSITEKFFLDALVEAKKLPDDNYKHVSGLSTYFGEVCPTNPRVEIQIGVLRWK